MRKVISSISIVLITAFSLIAVIVQAANVRIITIASPTSGQTFTTTDSIAASGNATVTGGDENFAHYGVKVTWVDTPNVTTPCIPVNSTFGWTTNTSNNHTYSTAGSKTIVTRLFHVCGAGSEPDQAEAVATVDINIVLPTCGISVSPDIDFESISPGQESSEKQTTITNTGTVSTTSLTIEGTNWSSGLNNIPSTQTHWSLSSGVSYDSMNDLNLSPSSESLGQNVSPSSPLDVFFKLKVPLNQVSGSYSQTITFTGDC